MECHFFDFLDLESDLSDFDLFFLSKGISSLIFSVVLSTDDFLELFLTSFSTSSTLGALLFDFVDLPGAAASTIAWNPGKSYSIPNSFNLVRFSFSF